MPACLQTGMLRMMKDAGTLNNNNRGFQLWQQHNNPVQLISNTIAHQKLDYIHYNPVEAGFVTKAEDWLYSSAIDYYEEKGLLEIKVLDTFVIECYMAQVRHTLSQPCILAPAQECIEQKIISMKQIKLSSMKPLFIAAIVYSTLLSTGCMEQNKKEAEGKELQAIFPKGELGPAENFTGNAWASSLVANDSIYNTLWEMYTSNQEQEATGISILQDRY